MALLTQIISVVVIVAVLATIIYGPPSSYIFDWTAMVLVLLIVFLSWTSRAEESERENFGEEANSDGKEDMISRYMTALEKTVIYHRGTDETGATKSATGGVGAPATATSTAARLQTLGWGDTGPFTGNANTGGGGSGGGANALVIPAEISARFAPVLLVCMPLPANAQTGSDKTWHNLASSAPTRNTYCADGSVTSSNLLFNRVPSILDNDLSRPSFLLGSGTSLEGPPCHQLGLDGDRSFTIFFIARITVPLKKADSALDAVQIFANTADNNGFSLSFLPAPSVVGVRVGAGRMIEGRAPAHAYAGGASWAPIADHFHLWVVSKTFTDVRVQAIDLESKTLEPVTVLQDTINDSVGRLIISNLPMQINQRFNWSAGLMMFGIGAKRVETGDVIALAQHYRAIFRDLDPEVLAFKARIKEMSDRLSANTSCPFNEAVCVACNEVADWSASDWYLNANEGCLRAVDAFCRANPSHPRCRCWASSEKLDGSSESEMSGAEAARCRRYRAIFDPSHNACPDKQSSSPQQSSSTTTKKECPAESTPPATPSPTPPKPSPPPRHPCLCKVCKDRIKTSGGRKTDGCNKCEMCKKLREMKAARAKNV